MEIKVRLSPDEIITAITAYLATKGYTVNGVRFNIDPGCHGDPREPQGPTLTGAECIATQTKE